jgi:hypothetical protein|tara:strand:- start:265 stop:672 length:408 start_codon:yes stop_codon:yes gene_type:complete
MSTFMLSNASITINSVDLSSYVTSITLSQSADSLEDTAMGDTSRSYIGGLKSGTVDIEFNADFAAAKTEATIFPLVGTSTAVVVKPVAASVSATNPSYSFNAICTEWDTLNGSVGEIATHSISWPITGAITKATS